MSDARRPKGQPTPKPSAESTSGKTGEADSPKVGYKQPPILGRIKDGEVRNPRGRPQGSKNKRKPKHDIAVIDMILANAHQEVSLKDKTSGQAMRMNRLQAVVRGLSAKAINGGVYASKYYIDLTLAAARAKQTDLEETAAALGEIKLMHYEMERKIKAGQMKRPAYLFDADELYLNRDGRVAARHAATEEDKTRWKERRQQCLVIIEDLKCLLSVERNEAQRVKHKQELEVLDDYVGCIDAALNGSREAMGYLDEVDLAVNDRMDSNPDSSPGSEGDGG